MTTLLAPRWPTAACALGGPMPGFAAGARGGARPCPALRADAAPMSTVEPSRRAEIARLYERYGHLVTARCRYLLKDPEAARDATQEVFVKAMRALDAFRGEAAPHTWLLRIATNHCLNVIAADRAGWKERFRQHVHHLDEQGLLSGADPERARLVQQLLAKMDPETQAVAIHYHLDEMTQEEIAALLGRSLPTIRKRLKTFERIAKKELGHAPV